MVSFALLLSLAACSGKEPHRAPASAASSAAAKPDAARPAPKQLHVAALPENAPRLAIVIDDLGRDRGSAERLLALNVPITFAVLPNLPSSADVAAAAHQAGREVILHLPMAANGARGPSPAEPGELHRAMDAAAVEQAVAAMLASVPYARGVNNHQGSSATQSRALMQAVMDALRKRDLYFLDSRTSAASVAYDAAQDAGMRAAYRTEFLDDTPERNLVVRQLQSAERRAREQGWAIAIGHPHAITLEVLEQMLPQMQARGIHFVFVSQIAK